MQVEALSIPDVKLLIPQRFDDSRGHFAETFNAARVAKIGLEGPWVQDNQSLSHARLTIRGLHCQLPPFAQGKLVRCVKGAIWDVAVDIRIGSPTFGQWAAATLTADKGEQLWVPPGFLHGFCTLEPGTEVLYKVTADYHRDSERGVIWNDRDLYLPWPVEGEPLLSDKDKILPGFSACIAERWFS
jgi:dTDP-4-dehydrorhamnose 3,5-epimerase